MAILILVLTNYLLDIVSPHHVQSRRENFGFWGSQMTRKCIFQPCSMDISVCQSTTYSVLCITKYPFTCLLKKASSFVTSIASPNFCHTKRHCPYLQVLMLFFLNGHSGGHGSSYTNLERKMVSQYFNDDKKRERILCENSIFIGQALAIIKKLYDEQK